MPADWATIYLESELAKENATAAEKLLAKGGQGKQPTLVLTSTYAQPFRRQVGAAAQPAWACLHAACVPLCASKQQQRALPAQMSAGIVPVLRGR